MKEERTVIIHGDKWKYEHVADEIEECKKSKWAKQNWSPSPTLVHKSGKSSTKYTGQEYNTEQFKYVKDGWDHDHCEICWWSIHDTEDEESKTK